MLTFLKVTFLLIIVPITTITASMNSESDSENSNAGIQLQNPLKIELAKDIASMAIESNLGSTCKTNVFIATEECENYVSFVSQSLSKWEASVMVLKYPKNNEETRGKSQIRKKHVWKHVLSRFHDPCKLVFICALIPSEINMDLPLNLTQDVSSSTIKNNEGHFIFSNLFRNIDQILYLSNNENAVDYSHDPQIKFLMDSENKVLNQSGVLLSVKLQNEAENSESLFRIYSRCKYCGEHIQNQSLGTWQRNRTIFSKFFQTFEQHKKVRFENYDGFKIGYLEYPPHISCEKPTVEKDAIQNCSGVEWEMLKQMSKSMEFQFTLENFTDRGQQGVIFSLDNITGMIGAVSSNELDVAVGAISVTPDKLFAMDVTDIFTHQPIEKRNDLYILGIWLAFEPEVWPLIIFTIASVAVIIELILRQKRRGKGLRSPAIKQSNVKGLEISIKPLLGQPLTTSQFPRRSRPILKLVLSLWWFTCLIISTVYNTNLIPSLINPVSPKEPESLKDLLESGFRFRVVSTKSAVSDILDKAGNDDDDDDYANNEYSYPFKQIKSRLIPYDDMFYYSRIAYVVEESAVRIVHWKKHNFGNIKVIDERLFLTGYGWPLRREAPYKDKFNTAISYLSAAGLIHHWYEKFTHKEKKPMEARFRLQEKIGQVKLDMEVLQGAFIFLVIGCFTALIIFAREQFNSRYTFRFFTIQEIRGFCQVLVRKVQELDFEQEVTRAGNTGIVFIAPLEHIPQRQDLRIAPWQRRRAHIFGNKNADFQYLK